jgi:hypothetical protein
MPNSVVVGKIRVIGPGYIILGGNLRIILPAHLSVADVQIGTSLTVVVRQSDDERLVAESVTNTPDP